VVEPRVDELDGNDEAAEQICDGAVGVDVGAELVAAEERIAAEERVASPSK
jgi:hypothetical protein